MRPESEPLERVGVESNVGAGLKPAPTVSQSPRRRNLRLRDYDYAQAGFYFVTICVQYRQCLFGEIIDGTMQLNSAGILVKKAWLELPRHYPHVVLDQFTIMPNHFHGIVTLTDADTVVAGLKPDVRAGFKPDVRAGLKPAPTKRHEFPEIIRAFKTFSARHINEMRQTPGTSVWQRNYYEHVIRNEADYERIAEYVENNPAKWEEDSLHPDNKAMLVHNSNAPITNANTPVRAGLKPAVRAGLKPAPTPARTGDADV